MFGFDKGFQIVQAGRPEDAVLFDPGINRAERLRIELVNSTAAFAVFADQVGAAQQAQVLGDCGTRDGERFGDLSGWLARRRRSRTARRVGSERAWKVASVFCDPEYVTDWFRIMRNLTVT